MFKKKPTIKPLAPLRSSDRRKLADQIIKEYNLEPSSSSSAFPSASSSSSNEPSTADQAEQTPEQQKAEAVAQHTALRNAILPENTYSARFTTTYGPELKQISGTVYVASHPPPRPDDGTSAAAGATAGATESRILWFECHGKLHPSIYTLWRNPSLNLVPLLHTPATVVSKLQGGADLMTPGLARGPPFPPAAKVGSVVAVASLENPTVPLVVGVCEVDVAGLMEVVGKKGAAVRSVHWAGDEAWAYGAGGKAGQPAPASLDWVGWEGSGGLEGQVGALQLDDEDDTGGGVALGNGNLEANGASEGGVSNGDAAGDTNGAAEEKAEFREFTQKEIDEAFRNAFLYGINKHKTNNANQPNFGLVFPISPSFVMSTLINPFLPAFTPEEEKQLQIKKTSWKNLKKFIKALDKEQIIKSKDMNGNETVILDIDFDDVAILEFKPYRLPKKETAAGTSQGRGGQATEQIDTGDEAVGQKLEIATYLRPTAKLSPLFASTDKTLLTPPEVREIVTLYIESNKLVSESNKRLINLDPTLANAVFDGSGVLDKEVIAKGSVPRDALIDRVTKAMNSFHAIVRNPSTSFSSSSSSVKPKAGPPPKVHITLETRSGNKTVTKVSGLEVFYVNPRLLADELRKVCAGSTSVEPLAGAAKKNERPVEEVMVQGPQKDAVVKALEKRGVDKRWVEFLDKTKGKKR